MEKINLSKEEILTRIGYFRGQKKVSACKLGRELGHSDSYFYRIEKGQISLSLETLLDALDYLGVTTTEFFCPTLQEDDITLLSLIKDLSKENQQVITDLIKKLK